MFQLKWNGGKNKHLVGYIVPAQLNTTTGFKMKRNCSVLLHFNCEILIKISQKLKIENLYVLL